MSMRAKYFLLLLIFFSCKKRYEPYLRGNDMAILVVEANMDPGDDSTFVRLTRTVAVSDTARIKPENNAQVIIEGADSTKRTLTGKGKGFYVSAGLHLTIGEQYRLRVKTAGGEEYLSDYVQAKKSPEIDSVTWRIDTVGLHFYVHTHDPSNKTIYYRWDCVEAWQIRMPHFAEVIYENGIIRDAVWPADNMWECWSYDSTQALVLGTSRLLSDDIISYKEIKIIPYHDEKVKLQLGLLAKQYAIDEAAYNFFSLMKQNTEAIGSLFSPQPFELRGNIRSVQDTSRYALGYVTSSTVTRQKKIVTGPELTYWRPRPSYFCDSNIVVRNNIADFRHYFDQLGYLPYHPVVDLFTGMLIGYASASRECVDCKARGAFPAKPYFW